MGCLSAPHAAHTVFSVLGPRTAVWAEKEVIEQAAYEFVDMEKMLTTAEEVAGPYGKTRSLSPRPHLSDLTILNSLGPL